ncbi:MAG: hypothetical protein PHG66_00935 [Candidatus Colwellbacteria bacterium]|nr:hypothetical protein [Candidatus Colwellbacteria bacterium]
MSIARYNEWVKFVSYGKKQSSQKNAVDYFFIHHSWWIRSTKSLVYQIENYTGKSFGVRSPRRSLIRCLNELIKDSIIVTCKRGEARFYIHSMYNKTSMKVPIIEENEESDIEESEDEKKSDIEESEDEKKSDIEEHDEKSDIEEKKSVIRCVHFQAARCNHDDNPLKISEMNLQWKVSPFDDEENDEIREMELYDLKCLIEKENRQFDGEPEYKFGYRPIETLGLIIVTLSLSYCFCLSGLGIYLM